MKHGIAVMTLFAGLLLAGMRSASAQHHGGHVPVHHGSNYGHNNWHHVVPHHPTYVGAYYTTGATHYYTPSPVTNVVAGGGMPIGSARVGMMVQKPVEMTFGGYSRFEDLAGRLTIEANALCLDLHYNYPHNRNFSEVYSQAYGVLQAAKYLHGKEHLGDRVAITQRMVEVDQLFHPVQEETQGWTREVRRQIGVGGLSEKIASVEAVVHHLCFDVGVKPHEAPLEEAPPPAVSTEDAPPPASGVGKQF